MLGGLFKRLRRDRHGPSVTSSGADHPERPGRRGLWGRIAAFLHIVWNGVILLAAAAGTVLAARLSVGFWHTADDAVDPDEATTLRILVGVAAVGALFLLWQVWRGIRYFRHRRER